MLKPSQKDLADMAYGVYQADLLINPNEYPDIPGTEVANIETIHNYLVKAHDFLQCLWAEKYKDAAIEGMQEINFFDKLPEKGYINYSGAVRHIEGTE